MAIGGLINFLSKEMKNKSIKNINVAKTLNISKTTISQYFSLSRRIPFFTFLRIVKIVFHDDVKMQNKLLKDFCRLTDKPENQRLAMEYFSINNMIYSLEEIVERERNSPNRHNRECAKIYEILLNRRKGLYTIEEFKNKVFNSRVGGSVKITELEVLLKITRAYLFFDIREYRSLIEISSNLQNDVKYITNKELSSLYTLRTMEIMFASHLLSNNLIEVEKLIKHFKEFDSFQTICPNIVASIYHWKAQYFLRVDVNKSILLCERALDMLKQVKNNNGYLIEQVQQTYDFIRIFNNLDLDTIKPSSTAECIHLYAKTNRTKEALLLLKQIEKENDSLTGFQLYYYYLCTANPKLLNKAVNKLINMGNRFYAHLILDKEIL